MAAADISRLVVSSVHAGLFFLLSDDSETAGRFISHGEIGVQSLRALLATVPPVVDPAPGELENIATAAIVGGADEFSVPLRAANGEVVASFTLTWSIGSEIVPGLPEVQVALRSADRRNGIAPHQKREPDSDRRLPSEQFVGSCALRLARLFAALHEPLDSLDRGPRGEAESAFLIHYADGDIYNGSLHQFYSNSTGNFASEFPSFADRIGAPNKAEAVRVANKLFDGTDLGDWNARNFELERFSSDQVDALDRQTREYYDSDELIAELLVAFVERSPGTFLC